MGEQEIVALLIGFGRISERVIVTTEERTEVNFNLQPIAISLEKLVVKGTAKTGGRNTP